MSKNEEKKKPPVPINKLLVDLKETLDDVNDKITELKSLSKGSKLFVIVGWFLMSAASAIIAYMSLERGIGGLRIFLITMPMVALIMIGYALAHKGLTGAWL